jgi:peptidoglycan/LPS O-acetylase OafA/YrhL
MNLKPGLSTWLDAMRWISSLAVVAGHVRQLVMISPSNTTDLALAWKGFYFITGFGHQAVIIFFVLSGFLVGGSVLDEFRQSKFQWKSYLVKRVSRLYPALLAALLLGGFMDWVGMQWWNETGVYSGHYSKEVSCLRFDATERLTWGILFGNLFMFQTILVPPLGTNGPLWSLCNEFWYYLLFPLLVGALSGRQSRVCRIGMGIFSLGLLVSLPSDIVMYFAIWLVGVGIHFLGNARIPAWITATLFLGVLIWSRVSSSESITCLLALSVAGVVWTLATSSPIPGKNLHKELAGFSYSLYVVHFPFIVLLGAFLHEIIGAVIGQEPTLRSLAAFCGILTCSIAWSFGISRITENRTKDWRNLLFAMVGSISRQPKSEKQLVNVPNIA